MNAITLRKISKVYKGQKLLTSINLDVKQGDIYAVIGNTNKQLLNRVVLGLVKPTSGEIYFWGNLVHYGDYHHLEKVGVATDDVYFYEELSGYENIKLYLEPYKKRLNRLDTISIDARMDNYFRLFNLLTSKDIPVKKYSLGMRQKLKLIRAFVVEPRVLVLEDPFKSLDPITIQILKMHLRKLTKEKDCTVFMSTSMLNTINNLVDKIGVLHDGQLIEQIDIEELKINQKSYLSIKTNKLPLLLTVLERYLNLFDFEVIDDKTVHILENFNESEKIIATLSKYKVPVDEVKYGYDSLETFFLDKIGV